MIIASKKVKCGGFDQSYIGVLQICRAFEKSIRDVDDSYYFKCFRFAFNSGDISVHCNELAEFVSHASTAPDFHLIMFKARYEYNNGDKCSLTYFNDLSVSSNSIDLLKDVLAAFEKRLRRI